MGEGKERRGKRGKGNLRSLISERNSESNFLGIVLKSQRSFLIATSRTTLPSLKVGRGREERGGGKKEKER